LKHRHIPLTVIAPTADDAPTTLAAPPAPRHAPPLSLYIHYPWCVRKCPYCDFNSHEARGAPPEAAYLEALIGDLESALPDIWGRRVSTIFFGGGTPSLLSAKGIDQLLAAIRARVTLLPDAEITLEANPGAVEHAAFCELAAAGITRLSLGIQSFNPRHLAALGRIHGRGEALAAADAAVRHFPTFNLDLMAALPGQTAEEAHADLDTALSFAPPHLSCYQLTVEPNTAFAHAPPADLPNADHAASVLDALQARLVAAGYDHYETSAFALPGQRCQHNLNYWQFGDYLGIGAGAHSKLTFPGRGIQRSARRKHPQRYLDSCGSWLSEQHWVSVDDRPFEFMMNALRLNGGVDAALFEERTGLPLTVVGPILEKAMQDDLLWQDTKRLGPTPRGQRFLNVLLERFL
jgi:oxygen-independent coproporphyrinogen-3 oxidase